MELKFYKKATKPSNLSIGSIWFNPNTKRIELSTGDNTSDVYGSNIQDASILDNTLTITKIDGSSVSLNPSDSTFDASAITSGTIALDRLPQGALERLFIVTDEASAMNTDCQEGDTIQVVGNSNKMYFCVNASATTFATKFHEYTAGTATSVPWSGVTGKPTIPTKTSQLANDSGFLTSAPVTSVNGQTGDVTIASNGALVYTAESLSAFTNILSYDDMINAVTAGREIWLIYNSDYYSLNKLLQTSDRTDFYFSATSLGEIKTIYIVWLADSGFRNINQHIYEISSDVATSSTFGLVKIGDNISVSDGTISVPTATSSTLGVVKVGSGLSVSNGTVSVDSSSYQTKLVSGTSVKTINGSSILGSGDITVSVPIATSSTLGKVMVPTSGNLTIDSSGNIKVPTASSSTAGVVKVGTGLKISSGVLSTSSSIPTAISDLTNDLDTETWTFTLDDGTTTTKTIYVQ